MCSPLFVLLEGVAASTAPNFLFFSLFLKNIHKYIPSDLIFVYRPRSRRHGFWRRENTSRRHGQWRRGLDEASDVAVTWHRRGQGLDAIDLGAELGAVDLSAKLLPYRSWRLK